MSLVTVSKNGAHHKRKFDHDLAREMYASGEWTRNSAFSPARTHFGQA